MIDPRIPNMIQKAQRILVVTHISPDGDAIGSLLGLGWALRAIGKETSLVCADPVPPPFHFLPGCEEIEQEPTGFFDLVIGLDASDPQRFGPVWERIKGMEAPLIVIDHHVTNLHFGTFNWVDVKAAATAEMIVELLEAMGLPLNPNIAQCLLCGVVTDTRGFRTSNTTPRTMAVATRLMEAGGNLNEITEQTLNRKPIAVLRLWGMALPRMQMHGRILWTAVTRAMREEAGVYDNGDGGLVNVLVSANEADIAVVFTEQGEGEIEVGMRAKPGFDVSQVALALGGGGHPQAAGCTIHASLEEAQERVLSALEASLRQQVA